MVLAKEGVSVPMTDLFGMAGTALLDAVSLKPAYTARVESLRDLIESFDRQVAIFERDLRRELAGHPGYRAIHASRRFSSATRLALVRQRRSPAIN